MRRGFPTDFPVVGSTLAITACSTRRGFPTDFPVVGWVRGKVLECGHFRPWRGTKIREHELLRRGAFIFVDSPSNSFIRAYCRSVTLKVRTLPLGGKFW